MNGSEQSIETLNDYFGIGGVLHFEIGEGGLTRAVINHELSEGEVYLYGAHITQFKPKGFKEVLFVSRESQFETGRPIRGGIPIAFPWFGVNSESPKSPKHGYARLRDWQLIRADHHASKLVLEFKTHINDFDLQYFIAFSEHLTLTLRVNSNSNETLTFEEAFHPYFAIGDAQTITIKGLEYDSYLDNTNDMQLTDGSSDALQIREETDRVYLNTGGTVEVIDPIMNRHIFIDKHHSKSTVVWNPWKVRAQQMSDFGDDEWQKMVCIEAANARSNHVTIKPGSFHEMTMVIRPEHPAI